MTTHTEKSSFSRRYAQFAGLLFALCLALAANVAPAQPKPRIEKAADLPRFSYAIQGKVEALIRSPERFAPFAAAVRKDTEAVLADYDIADKATQRSLVGTLARLDFLEGRYDSVLARVAQIRALQDKPADKLVSGALMRASALSAQAIGTAGEAYARGVAEALQDELGAAPYPLIENDVKSGKAGAELIGETLVLGQAREVIQPIVDRSGTISSDFAPAVVNARYALVAVLPLKPTLVAFYGRFITARTVAKIDIWADRDVALQPSQIEAPVVVAVWDSGVDTKLFGSQVVRDASGPALIAFDKYSRLASGELFPLPPEQQARAAQLAARTKGFADLQASVDSPEASEVKTLLSSLTAAQYRPAIEELRMTGNYSHGTHVAGITLAGNPGARLVVARIDFGYTLKPDPCPSAEQSERDSGATQAYVDFLKTKGVRVVNMSWGGDVSAYESDLEKCGIGKTAEERKALARTYFDANKAALTRAFASAPGILFVTSAGNSNNDASFIESIPSGIVLPNLITVGAVDSAGEEAPFTSYGPTVRVHANGYQVESYIPGGTRVALSGTSMSSPQVANLAGKLLAVRPELTPEQLIGIISATADHSADGRRNLVNPKKALAAAMATAS